MKTTRLLQIPIALTLFFGSIGTNGHVSASTVPQPHEVLQTQPSISIALLPTILPPGETATATISLNNIPAEGYTSAEFTCTYPANLIQVSNVTLTGLFGSDPAPAIHNPQDGTLIVGIAGSQGNRATAGGPAFTFHFVALATGQVEVDCTARVSDGSNVLTGIGSASAGLTIMEATATPTITPTACDKAELIGNTDVLPSAVMMPGTQFTTRWTFKNIGTCVWTTSYRLAFYSGEQMGAVSSSRFSVSVAPGQAVILALNMIAPSAAGSYRGYWIFQNDTGKSFGVGSQGNQPWFVDIVVSNANATPTFTSTPSVTPERPASSPTPSETPGAPTNSPTPSPTNAPTATPVSGTYFDFVAQAYEATWYSGAGELPYPGIDGNPNGFAYKVDNPRLENGVVDTRPGLLTVPQNIQNGYIQGVYPPIHVQSGDRFRSMISCESGATDCYVAYRLDYQVGSDPIRTFWGPFLERYEGQVFVVDIDLSSLAGKDVKFRLTVLAESFASGDRALWVGPIIYRSAPTPTSPVPSATFTPSMSPTATPSADLGTLTGQIHAGKPVGLSVYRDNAIFVTSTMANADGTFNFTLPAGTYLLVARADGFLAAQGFVTITAGNTSAMPVISLPAGDIDGNDVIDQFDVLTIGMNYNTSFPPAADLNNDGIINVLDLELLAKNYRTTGPVPWP